MRDLMTELKELRLHGMASAWEELVSQGTASTASSKWLLEHLLQQEQPYVSKRRSDRFWPIADPQTHSCSVRRKNSDNASSNCPRWNDARGFILFQATAVIMPATVLTALPKRSQMTVSPHTTCSTTATVQLKSRSSAQTNSGTIVEQSSMAGSRIRHA